MTDTELTEARQRLEELGEAVRQDLAKDLGGDPDDYRAEAYQQDRTGDGDSDDGRD